MKSVNNKQRGQGMTEYVILVALIAIVAIGGFTTMGKNVKDKAEGLGAKITALPS